VRDLNAIAPLVTMFFLITYCMINVVVLLEGSLGLVSYRPTLQVPLIVPFIGLVGCLFSMFIVNPTFSLVSLAMVVALYLFIRQRQKDNQGSREDVRSSIFVAFAEWAASRVTPEDLDNIRTWKPHLLVPVEDVEELRGSWSVLMDLARPEGSIKLLGLATLEPADELAARLEQLGNSVRSKGVLASWSVIALPSYANAIPVGLMALQGAFFRPNLLFTRIPAKTERRGELVEVMGQALQTNVGVCLYCPHPAAGLGQEQTINVWISPGRDSWDPNAAFDAGNLNLILLMGFRLWRIWRGSLTVITIISDPADEPLARQFLDDLCDLVRFPAAVQREVRIGALDAVVRQSKAADMSIFGLNRENPSLEQAEHLVEISRSSCLFMLDSGQESARA
jgi:solute carrier family 12 sodium/potassium/chloride transporter 2